METHPNTEQERPDNWPKKMPFRVPSDYFSRQRISMLKTIQRDLGNDNTEALIIETSRISPLLGELKRKGISGRWDKQTPETQNVTSEHQESDTSDKTIAQVRSITGHFRWVAAAAFVGLIFLGKSLMDRQKMNEILTDPTVLVGLEVDSMEVSDEDIRFYLSETMALPETNEMINTKPSAAETFHVYADLLATPESYTQEMDSIPVHDLEAFVNDIPALND